MRTEETFYVVWNPDGPWPPKVSHNAYNDAYAEAVRLAQKYRKKQFIVLAAVTRVEASDVHVTDYSGVRVP